MRSNPCIIGGRTRNMYFPIFIDLSDREILMVGGGTIAARRVKSLCGFAGQDYGRGTGGM